MSLLSEMTVEYKILRAPAPTLSIRQGGWEGSIAFLVAYDDLDAFMTIASGVEETFFIGDDNFEVTRVVPLRHPDYPDRMIAADIHAEAIGGAGGTGPSVLSNMFSMARVVIGFASTPFAVEGSNAGSPYSSIQIKMGGTYITLPRSGMKFPSDNSPLKDDVGVFVPEMNYSVTTYYNSSLDDTTIISLIGKVNSAVFLGAPIGTVRFDGCDSQSALNVGTQISYTKTYAISYRPRPWNQVMRPTGSWEAPVDRVTGEPKHASADLRVLL